MQLSPEASSFTTACPGPALGSGTSSSFITSGPPGVWTRIAFMSSLSSFRGGQDNGRRSAPGPASVARAAALHLEQGADLLHHTAPPVHVALGVERAPGLEHLLLDLLRLGGRPLDEAGDLLHVLVEEREHRDGPVHALIEVLVHQLLVLVAEEDAQVDVGIALDHLGEHGDVVESVTAPVLGDDEHVELLAVLVEGLLVLGRDLDRLEELDELVLVRPHLREVLVQRHPLLELLLGHHRCGSFPSQRMADRSTVNVETSFSSELRTTRV